MLDFVIKRLIIKIMKQELFDTIKSVIDSLGLSLYHTEFKGNVLRVLLEAKNGPFTMKDCTKAAQALSAKLDTLNLISHRYYLEVSSPGIERSLLTPEHYKRYKGQNCSILTYQGKILGRIIDADEDMVKIETLAKSNFSQDSNSEGAIECINIPFAQIKAGHLKISDEVLFGKVRDNRAKEK